MKAKRNPASVLARLLDLAKQRSEDYSLLLNRFGLERLLDRLSRSRHADRFLLKGALLFSLWYDQPHRPTRDADLLGFGPDGIWTRCAPSRSARTTPTVAFVSGLLAALAPPVAHCRSMWASAMRSHPSQRRQTTPRS